MVDLIGWVEWGMWEAAKFGLLYVLLLRALSKRTGQTSPEGALWTNPASWRMSLQTWLRRLAARL